MGSINASRLRSRWHARRDKNRVLSFRALPIAIAREREIAGPKLHPILLFTLPFALKGRNTPVCSRLRLLSGRQARTDRNCIGHQKTPPDPAGLGYGIITYYIPCFPASAELNLLPPYQVSVFGIHWL